MELQHHKFGFSGSDMHFAVFADDLCRISYVGSVTLPIGHSQVELYGIQPGAKTKWVVVKQLDGHKATLKVFLRQNEKFLENEIDDLPQETKSQILQRFPNLVAEEKPRQVRLGKEVEGPGNSVKGFRTRSHRTLARIENRPRENEPVRR